MILEWLALLAFAAEGGAPAAADGEPKLIIDAAGFPYASVDAAMDALLDNRETEIQVKQGWTEVTGMLDGVHTHWAFTPSSHPAHPAAVRRTPLEKDGEIWVQMTYRCEAKQREACDALIEEFRKRNAGMLVEFKRRLGLLDHPRQAEAIAFAERWLDMVDQGRDDDSLALLTNYSRSGYTPAEWRRVMNENRTKQGALELRRLRRTGWFENPPDVPLAGTFVFLEFEAIYEHEPYLLQRVVLHADPNGEFRVMKDEAPFLRLIRARKPK